MFSLLLISQPSFIAVSRIFTSVVLTMKQLISYALFVHLHYLHFSCVNHEAVNLSPFSTSALPYCFVIATEGKFTLETFIGMIHSIYLDQQAHCISHQSQSSKFTVSSVKSTEHSESSHIYVLDEFTFQIIHKHKLEKSGFQKGEMLYCCSMLSCVFSGDDRGFTIKF